MMDYNNFSGVLRRGFLHRTVSALLLCALFGFLLVIPSVSSETEAQLQANAPLYSHWREGELLDEGFDDDIAGESADFSVGSFSLHRPQSELFMKGLVGELYDIAAAAAVESGDIENYLHSRARAQVMDTEVPDFKRWLSDRGEGITERIFINSADYLTDYLSAAAVDNAEGLNFVRTVEWDYQTALGNRRWQTGISALGALRESADDAVAWQLRGYAAEDSGIGANAGLIYRRAVDFGGDALVGANVFLDYEENSEYGEDFLRWSAGAEYRNAHLDIYLNRYFPISDAVLRDGSYIYTQGGEEAYINLKIPQLDIGQVAGGFTYYRWQGEYGDADDKGLRYHIRYSPHWSDWHFELELDSPDRGGVDWGGRISYHYTIGSAQTGIGALAAESAFDARAHFFDALRREYAQRIRRSDEKARIVVARVLDDSSGTAQLAILEPTPAAAAAVVTLSVVNGVGETHTLTLSARTISITVEMGTTLQLSASNWLATIYEGGMDRLMETGGRLEVVTSTTAFERFGDGLNTLLVGNVTIDLLGTKGKTGRPPLTSRYGLFTHLTEGNIALTVAARNRMSVELFGFAATAFVDLPPSFFAPQDTAATVQLTLACSTPEQRDDHRIFQEDYIGCVGDVRLSDLAADRTVYLHAQGKDLTLAGVAGGGIAVVEAGVTSSIVYDSYPFHPHNATLEVLNGAVSIAHGRESGELAALSVAADSEVVFLFAGAGATATVAVSIYAAVFAGAVSDIGSGGVVDCIGNSASLSEGLVSVVAACDGVSFASAGDEMDLIGRVGLEQMREVQVTGGGGIYDFELLGADANLFLAAPTGAAAVLMVSPDESLYNSLRVVNAGVTITNSAEYSLRASPRPPFDAFVADAQVDIHLRVLADFAVENPAAPGFVRTEIDRELALYQVAYEGSADDQISIDICVCPGPAFDSAFRHPLRGHFAAAAGNRQVNIAAAIAPESIAQRAPPNPADNPPTLEDAPLPVTVLVSVTDIYPQDEALNAADMVSLTVTVRHPSGDVTATYNYASVERNGNYAVYNRAAIDGDVFNISDTRNAPDSNGVSVSGISVGGHYNYRVVNTLPAGFVLATAEAPGTAAALRVDSASPPALGRYDIVLAADDDHSLTEPFLATASVEIITTLPLLLLEVKGELQPSPHPHTGLNDEVLNKDLLTLTARGGDDGNNGANYQYALSGADADRVQLAGNAPYGAEITIRLKDLEGVDVTDDEADTLQIKIELSDGGMSTPVTNEVAIDLLTPLNIIAPSEVTRPAPHDASEELFVVRGQGGDDKNNGEQYVYKLSGADADAGRVRFSRNPNGGTAAAVEIGDLSDLTLDDAVADRLQAEVVLNDGGVSAPLSRVVNINLLAPLALPAPAAVTDGLVHKKFPHAADEELFVLAATGGDGDYTYAIEPALSGADNVVRINGDKVQLSAAVTDNLPRLIEMTIQVTDGANSTAATRAVTVDLLTPLALDAPASAVQSWVPHDAGKILFAVTASGGNGGAGGANYAYEFSGRDSGKVQIVGSGGTVEIALVNAEPLTNGEAERLQFAVVVRDGKSPAVSENVAVNLQPFAVLALTDPGLVIVPADSDGHSAGDALFVLNANGGDDRNNNASYEYALSGADADAGRVRFSGNPNGNTAAAVEIGDLSDLTLDDAVADRLQAEVILNDGGMSAPLPRVVNIDLLAPLVLPVPTAVRDGLVHKQFPHAADEELFALAATGGDGDYTYAIEPALSGADNVVRINGDKAQLSAAVTDNLPRLIEMTIQVTDGANSIAATRVVTVSLLTPLAVAATPTDLVKSAPHIEGEALFRLQTSGGDGTYNYRIVRGDDGGVIAITKDEEEGVFSLAKAVTEEMNLQLLIEVTDTSGSTAVQVVFPLRLLAALVVAGQTEVDKAALHRVDDALFEFSVSGGLSPYNYEIVTAAVAANALLEAKPSGGRVRLTQAVDLSDSAQQMVITIDVRDVRGEKQRHEVEVNLLPDYILVIGGDSGGANNDVWRSLDGANWTQLIAPVAQRFPARYSHAAVALSGTVYVSGGSDGVNHLNDVWASANGNHWTLQTQAATADSAESRRFSARSGHDMLAYQGTLFVIGGSDGDINADGGFASLLNDIWYSTDGGVNWDALSGAAGACANRTLPLSFVYAQRVIVAGGYRAADGGGFALAEDVRAFDGENCGSSFGDLPPPVAAVYGTAAQKHAGVLLDGEMYILGAANVFASAGGGGWETKTDSAAFGDLSNHAAVVHRGTMFVIGGRAGADVSGKVWVSTGGENWQERTAAAGADALPGRIRHAAVVLGKQSFTLPPPAPPLVLTGPTEVVKPEATHSLGRELFTVVAAGGAGDYVYSIASASPAGHIGIDAASGVASIAATVDVSTRIIINTRVRDGDNDTADFEVTVDLLRPLVVTGPTEVVYSTAPHIKGRDLFMITVRGGTESYSYGIGAVAPADLAGNFGISGGSVPVAPRVAGGAVTLAVTLAATVATASRAVVAFTVSDGEQTALLDITVQLSAVVNYMLVIGGLNENSDATNDVWLSLDGEQWERLEIQGAMFEERYRHAAAVLGGTVYVSGGLAATGSRYLNDVWASTDGVHWQRKTSNFPSRSNHRMVASGGTLFVMGGVAQDGPRFEVTQRDIWYSTSAGSTWSRLDNERTSACNIGRHPLAFAYKEQVLLAGGVILNGFRYEFVNEARSLRANECNDWATLPQGTADAFGSVTDPHLPKVQGVLLEDTMYLMGASDVWSSANGVDWTAKTAAAGFAGAQAFVGSGAGDLISHAAVAHNNRLFVIGGRKDDGNSIYPARAVWSSADGVVWSEAADAADNLPHRRLHAAVALGPQSHIAPPNTPLVVTGPTEVVQSTAPHTEGRYLFAVTARGGAANDYTYSIDGVTPADLEGNFGISGSGTIRRASPGAAVTLTVTLRATVDAASRATVTVAVSDGVQTAQRGVTVELSAVIDHILVIGGETGEIAGGQGDASNEVWWSADGKAWTLLPAPRSGAPIFEARRRHAGVAVSGTVYISGGRGLDNNAQEITYNDVWASTDGIHWQRRTDTAPSRYNHQMVAYNNTLFIMGGEPQSERDIWHSSDWGATWQAFAGDSGACNTAYESLLFVYDRYMLIAGGVLAEAQDSTEQDPNRFIPQVRLFDGEQCRGNTGIVPAAMIDDFGTAAGFDAANGWAGALFGNSTAADMYISGRSAVWSSANGGATWTARERDADFSAAAALDGAAGMLEAHALTAFDEKLFIIGGQSGERTRTGNVWSSADGKGWEIRTGAGAATQDFARRSQHVAVVLGTPQPPPPAPVVLTGPTMVVQSQMPPSTGEMLFTLTAYGGSGNYAYGIAAVSPAGYTGINPASGKVSIIARGADMDTSSRVVMTAIVWDPGNGFASVTVTVDLSVPLVVTGPTAKVQSPAPHTKGRDLFAITVRGGYGTRGYNYEVSVVTPAGADTPSPLTYNFGYTVISNSAAAATLMFTLAATVAEPAEATLQIIVNDGNETVEVLVTAALSAAVSHIFVIGGETAQGDSNEVWWSAGGEEWRLLPAGQIFEPRRDHAAIVVSGTIYISGGSSGDGGNRFNDVWASTDGVHWQQKSTAAFTARSKHGMFARNGTLFIIGGEFADGGRDIWRSDDLGETWNPFTDVPGVCDIGADSLVFAYDEYALIVAGKNAQTDFIDQVRLFDGAGCIGSLGRVPQAVQNDFGARSDDLAGVVFNGNMHLLGRSAVWSSPADVTWTRKTENAQFSGADAFGGVAGALTGHAAVVHDGAMFVIGGERSEGNAPGGVWSSANGESWTRRAETAADDSPAERFPFPGRAGHAAVALPYAALPQAPLVLLGPMELLTSRHPHRAGGALFTVVARGGGGTGEYEYVFSPANGNIGIHASGGLATIKAAVTVSTRITLTVVALDDSVNKSASLTVTVDVLPPARVLMFGGQYGEVASTFKNDVWASIDGENWTLLTRSATFGGRTGIAATQLGGTLYFSGGTTNGDDRLHSVWSSVDGINWTWRNRNTERALRFPGRYHHKMVAVDGALYVLGGTGGNDENGERILFSDLWQSTDEGETWRLLQGVLERGTEIIDGFEDIGSDHESFVAFGTRGRVWAFGRRDNFDLLWFTAPDLGWLRNVTSPSWEDILGITVTGPFSRRTPLLYPDSPFHPHREHRYFGAAGAVFNDRLYMFAHERIFSTVGAGWREEQTLSQYANYPNNPRIDLRRVGHQVVAINGKLLVVGGVFHNLDELQQSDESGVNRLDNTAWVSVGNVGGAGVLNWRPVAAEGAADFARVGHALIVQEPSGQ